MEPTLNRPQSANRDLLNPQKKFMRTKNRLKSFFISCLPFCIISAPLTAAAQPSGGPYGPLAQTYDLPDAKGRIHYVAPGGKSEASGETLSSPTTLEAAIARVETGDAIVLRGGTYRTGDLIFNQGITIQPYADEQPVLKGTFIAGEWKDLGNGLWTTPWSRFFRAPPADWWRRHRAGKETPLYRFNNDMVFVDGKFLHAVGWEGEVDENTYYIDYDAGMVYIGTDPTNRLVEITAFSGALIRTTGEIHGKKPDHRGPEIRGLTITQYAYRGLEIQGREPEGLADESTFGKDVVGTTVEHCSISYCARVGAHLKGDSLTLRHCRISDTGTEGVYVVSSSDILLEKNIFTRNNIERIIGYYPAAVKIFNQCHRATCQDNLVIDLPYSNGIWYDVGNVDGRFLNNWVENVNNKNEAPAGERAWKPHNNGFFFEISKGAICAGNVFVDCNLALSILNSSDVHIYQNTFVNSPVAICRTDRGMNADHFGWHPTTGPAVNERYGHVFVNNLLSGDEDFHRPLLYVWQPDTLYEHVKNPQVKLLDQNIYVRGPGTMDRALISWTPATKANGRLECESPGDLQELHPGFSIHSQFFPEHSGPLFTSAYLKRYQLLHAFTGSGTVAQLPAEISKVPGEPQPFIGAYPPSEREGINPHRN